MKTSNEHHLTKTEIAKLELPEDTPVNRKKGRRYDDDEVKGLFLLVYPSGAKRWKVYFRANGRQRFLDIGDAAVVQPAKARAQAREKLGLVAQGIDPASDRDEARAARTVSELCDEYLKTRSNRKRLTVEMDRHQIETWLRPRWGKRKVADIGAKAAEDLHRALSATPVRANRLRSLVHHMFQTAIRWGWHPGPNPAAHVERYKETPVHRPLSELELVKLGRVLADWPNEERVATRRRVSGGESETVSRKPTKREAAERKRIADVIRLLILTGCRRSEIVKLTWDEVDLEAGVLRLRDSKSGARVVFLAPAAVDLLRQQDRAPLSPYVFTGRKQGAPIGGLQKAWERIRRTANIEGVRLHDLRHTVGARAAEEGLGQAQIAKLLGHRQVRTTDRYSTPTDNPSARGASLVGGTLARDLGITGDAPTGDAEKAEGGSR